MTSHSSPPGGAIGYRICLFGNKDLLFPVPKFQVNGSTPSLVWQSVHFFREGDAVQRLATTLWVEREVFYEVDAVRSVRFLKILHTSPITSFIHDVLFVFVVFFVVE